IVTLRPSISFALCLRMSSFAKVLHTLGSRAQGLHMTFNTHVHACHSGRASRAVPGAREPESSKPRASCYTRAVVYWVPARARPAEPGSLGRDDSQMRLPLGSSPRARFLRDML